MYLWGLATGVGETLNHNAECVGPAGRSEQPSSLGLKSEAAAEASVASKSESKKSEKSGKSNHEECESSTHANASTQSADGDADGLGEQHGAADVWKLSLAVLVSSNMRYHV
jgi:hypothetical protein